MKDARAVYGRWVKRWPFLQFQPLRLPLDGQLGVGAAARRRVLWVFALIAAGLVVTLAPVHADGAALGSLSGGGAPGFVPALCFFAGDLCLAAGVWSALAAARDRPLERQIVAGLGVIAATLTGQCVRLILQIVVLRGFYRPSLIFTSPARAAAVGWGTLLAVVLVSGFLAPLAVAAVNLLPRAVADSIGPVRWLASRRWWLLLPFAALALTAIITQWVLSSAMAAAMGYQYPAPSGALVTVSLRDLGPAAWNSLQVLVALPLLVLMWEGVESARTCHRLVRHNNSETPLLMHARRIDYRLPAAAVVLAAAAIAATHGNLLAMLAGIALILIVSLSLGGQLGRVARLARSFERGVSRWQLPEGWREIGRISLLLGILVFPVLIVLCGDIFIGAKEGLWFPFDLHGFYPYWQNYGLIKIPVVSASAIYGHVEVVIWAVSLGLAAAVLLGMMINIMNKKERRDVIPALWFLIRVGLLAFVLAPVARLADHSYATFLLTACAVVVILLTFKRETVPPAVWSAVLAGGALALWSLALWRATWLPAAALLGLTVLQRFFYNAGEINRPDKYRVHRISYFQSISLVAVAMLALGHGAADGYFESEELSKVSDRVALSVIAVIWLVMLIARQVPRSPALQGLRAEVARPGDNRSGNAAEDDDPLRELSRQSWAWLLDPQRALLSFTGRQAELAALLAWCEDEHAARLRLMTGPGGVGKTRLALELAGRLRGRGWNAQLVQPGGESAVTGILHAGPGDRALLVVDNADTCADLQQVLTALVRGEGSGLRVLLLARSSGEWCIQPGVGSPAVQDLLRRAQQAKITLSAAAVADGPDHTIVAQAATAIAKKLGLREAKIETRYKTSAARLPMLELHAAALFATLTDATLASTGTGTVQADIRQGAGLSQLLSHEQEFWYGLAEAHGLLDGRHTTTTRLLRQVIATGWLLGAASADDACDLADRVPGTPAPPGLREWLLDLYTAGHVSRDGNGFILPSRLAELHTLRELIASLEFTQACFAQLTEDQAIHAVTFLARASVDYQEADILLKQILPDLPDHITDLLAPAETLTALLRILPTPSTKLAPAALALTRRILAALPTGTRPELRAYWLSFFSARLTDVGQIADAALAEQEATAIRRKIAAARAGEHPPDPAPAC
jgi:hypothetical protein